MSEMFLGYFSVRQIFEIGLKLVSILYQYLDNPMMMNDNHFWEKFH